MQAVVDSLIRLPLDGLPARALAILHRELTVPNPEYVERVRYGRWVGTTPEELPLYEERHGQLLLPRGAHKIVRQALDGLPLVWDDRRTVCAPLEVPPLGIDLRDYQAEAAFALVHNVQGLVVFPCGAGKSNTGAAAIARAAQPTLIIVHTNDLLEQWLGVLKKVLGVDAGVLGGGTWNPRPITVATVQTCVQRLEDLRAIAEMWGAVIVDEAHHAPADTFRKVLAVLPGRYRWGLTATPKREDGLTCLLELGIGSIVYQLSHEQLVAAGHLVLPEVRQVKYSTESEAAEFAELVRDLVEDEKRNTLIVDLVEAAIADGRQTMVLSQRVQHCRHLAVLIHQRIAAKGSSAWYLTGGVDRHDRNQIRDRLAKGEVFCVCATTVADEGLDAPRLETLILATPAKAEGRTIQRLGRLMRPAPGKRTPQLIDIVDEHPIAMRQASARRRAFKKVLGA